MCIRLGMNTPRPVPPLAQMRHTLPTLNRRLFYAKRGNANGADFWNFVKFILYQENRPIVFGTVLCDPTRSIIGILGDLNNLFFLLKNPGICRDLNYLIFFNFSEKVTVYWAADHSDANSDSHNPQIPICGNT